MELTGWQTLQIRYVNKEFGTGTPERWFCIRQMGRTEAYTVFCRTWQTELFSTFHKSHGISLSRGGKNKGFFALYLFSVKKPTLFVLLSSFATSGIYTAHKNLSVVLSVPQGTSQMVQLNFSNSIEMQCLSHTTAKQSTHKANEHRIRILSLWWVRIPRSQTPWGTLRWVCHRNTADSCACRAGLHVITVLTPTALRST